ncbi:hypothetical protein C4D60_Mb00t05370 [Musa balbisiana]|uniref:Uncharacterized protein n=1 Tax=Musa balbisiana TaxID=52838 RepID=A0A4S8I1L8_MUSBA|nr:hypothetical protein C4D60_Mb00t05370 [Musa balbisiana]
MSDSLVRVSRRVGWGAHWPMPRSRVYPAGHADGARHVLDRIDGIPSNERSVRASAVDADRIDPHPEPSGGPADRRSASDRGASPVPIRFPPGNFKHSLTLFSKSFSSFPRGSEPDGALTLPGAPFQGTWARSVAEDASPDYNSDDAAARFSSWADPGSLAVTKGILVQQKAGSSRAGMGARACSRLHRSPLSLQHAKTAIFCCASEPGQHISAVCSWVWGLGVIVLSEPNCIQGCWDATEGRFEQGRDGGTCVQQIASRSRALQQRPHHCNASLRLVESKSLARYRIPLVRTSSESAVRRPGKAPEGAVPGPSPGRHAATRSRRESSSSSPPTADGFGAGTPVPSPQSQSFSRSYGSVLPTSLAYIVPWARGCSPWRPDAVMSTTGRGRHSVLRIFKGRRGRTGRRATCGALPAAGPYLRLSRFQGGRAVKQKR